MATLTLKDLVARMDAQDARMDTVVELLKLLAAGPAGSVAPVAGAPVKTHVDSPSQVAWKTRTAGTCVLCGRKDFRTLKGALTHVLNADSTAPCAQTPERDAGFAAK